MTATTGRVPVSRGVTFTNGTSGNADVAGEDAAHGVGAGARRRGGRRVRGRRELPQRPAQQFNNARSTISLDAGGWGDVGAAGRVAPGTLVWHRAIGCSGVVLLCRDG